MRARDLMSSPVVTVTPRTPVKEAAGLLARHGFTALPVVDDDERLVGVVTEADLIRGGVPRDIRSRHGERDLGQHRETDRTVGAVMSTPAVAMGQGTDVADLCQALTDSRIRSMPIVDGSTVVGIVTRRDIVRALSREDSAIAADVRHRLEIYGGGDRWDVTVRDGVVRVTDTYDDETDRHVATLLAQAVPGVVDAHTVATSTTNKE
ncbi:CBS domain-containing protein [Amycolatopsis suaedae]|uniref:CBS domain-containing protein n=1 Tax=Amycolatopsis suaedae TaxID=2510978 RepID=A0A4Q7JEI8_9PSEU|nr:CBS domain-containing protein [Amycolatopsis suaedae]RZQ65909.1 CBS domain-containing protein [Amycolatopsis suaedae]